MPPPSRSRTRRAPALGRGCLTRAAGLAGAGYALLAYASWGLTPIYWKWLAAIPPVEILLHRIAGTALVAALLLSLAGIAVLEARGAGALGQARQLGAPTLAGCWRQGS